MFIVTKTSNHVPNPVRGCMFMDPGPSGSGPAELVKPPGMQLHICGRKCSLAAACYKHATPDGVGNVTWESAVT